MSSDSLRNNIDWVGLLLYAVLVLLGWINIYAAVYNPDMPLSVFDMSHNAGKQLLWIGLTIVIIIIPILVIDYKFYNTFAYYIYGITIFSLFLVFPLGTNINGSHSWIKIGSFSIQPAEFAKMGTVLALAKYLSTPTVNLGRLKEQINVAFIILIPAFLIILSKETGSMLVFAGLLIMLYREGLSGIYPLIVLVMIILFVLSLLFVEWKVSLVLAGLMLLIYWWLPRYERTHRNFLVFSVIYGIMVAYMFTTNFVLENVLQPHQSNRIKVLINPNIDPWGQGWNVTQSKIAVGSGGFLGKGFLEGTQTKFDYVPEQSTDFIFCTVGEEHGFLGTLLVVGLMMGLIWRIIFLAEKQRSRFVRIYGYGVASIFFFHFLVNIGMTIGLVPVIGIPLPFFSYGGSSMWSFTILLFIFLKLDAHRQQMLSR